MSHSAISAALEFIPPAGFVLSLANASTGLTVPLIRACGVAALEPPPAAECRTVVRCIPRGARMRFEMKSSQVWPLTDSMTSPATR